MAARTEASKIKWKKRRKSQQQYVLSDAQLETDKSAERGLHASPDSPIDMADEHDSHVNKDTVAVKNKRGPTKLKGLGMHQNERVEVEFNERGQPIGDNSVSLATFTGALVRSTVPILYKNWTEVPMQQKEDMWTIILQRYKLDEDINKEDMLHKMAGYLREYRSRIGTKVRAIIASGIEEAHLDLAKLKPENLTDQEWKDFVKRVCSKAAKQREKTSGAENVQPQEVVATPERSQTAINTNNNIREPVKGQKCKIMSWYKKGEIVAEGRIASTDHESNVHHQLLGLMLGVFGSMLTWYQKLTCGGIHQTRRRSGKL